MDAATCTCETRVDIRLPVSYQNFCSFAHTAKGPTLLPRCSLIQAHAPAGVEMILVITVYFPSTSVVAPEMARQHLLGVDTTDLLVV